MTGPAEPDGDGPAETEPDADTADDGATFYNLRLYIAGRTARSAAALANLTGGVRTTSGRGAIGSR